MVEMKRNPSGSFTGPTNGFMHTKQIANSWTGDMKAILAIIAGDRSDLSEPTTCHSKTFKNSGLTMTREHDGHEALTRDGAAFGSQVTRLNLRRQSQPRTTYRQDAS